MGGCEAVCMGKFASSILDLLNTLGLSLPHSLRLLQPQVYWVSVIGRTILQFIIQSVFHHFFTVLLSEIVCT